MSRLRRIALTDRIFFITTNLQPRATHFSPRERTLLLEALDMERRRTSFFLYGYVVMPSHLHLLLDPGQQALSDVLRNFKSKAALSFVKLGTRRDPFWQPRYHDSICRRARNFGDKLEYIHITSSRPSW
jgi:putative transposase